MSDQDELDLIKSYLAAPGRCASPEAVRAWEDFFQVHEPLIRNLIKECTDCREDDEDVAQEVWVTLSRKLPELEYDPARGPLRAWVIVVARRAARRESRRLKRNRADALTAELVAVLVDPSPDPMALLEREQERQWVRSILAKVGAKLSALSHWIAVLYWIDGQSLPQIAAASGVSEDRARMRLQRVLKKLRALASAGEI